MVRVYWDSSDGVWVPSRALGETKPPSNITIDVGVSGEKGVFTTIVAFLSSGIAIQDFDADRTVAAFVGRNFDDLLGQSFQAV
jgi:hypothetical protein